MMKKVNNKIVPIIVIGILTIGNIAFVESGLWNVSDGKAIDITAMNASAYQVQGVLQSSEGYYIVNSKSTGFQSDIEVAVTFDTMGIMIEQVEIVAQGETAGIGTKVTDASFLNQFSGVSSPLGLIGTQMIVTSPETGAVWRTDRNQRQEDTMVAIAQPGNQDDWNAFDKSAEATAIRNLYQAGLLTTAIEKKPLATARADYSPEERSLYQLQQAGLLTTTSTSDAAIIDSAEDFVEVDSVSGATISSTAVVNAVDQAYLFMQEKILN